jgi:hypothetical protein
VLFLAALSGQAIAGHAEFNALADQHGSPHMSLARYIEPTARNSDCQFWSVFCQKLALVM